jgi:YHS domain-containing protein
MNVGRLPFLFPLAATLRAQDGELAVDPACGMQVSRADCEFVETHRAQAYYFRNRFGRDSFVAGPDAGSVSVLPLRTGQWQVRWGVFADLDRYPVRREYS